MNFFAGDPYMNILFLIISICSIVLAFVFYYRSKKIKAPVYNLTTTNLIHSNISTIKNVEIRYKGNLLKNLSLTKIAFWNSGQEPIRREDLVSSKPLTISMPEEGIIYGFEIEFENAINNLNIIKRDDNSILFDFDFLDFRDGFVLSVYHSNISNKNIVMHGKIIGGQKITLAVQKDLIIDKMNFVFKPLDFLANHEKFILRILGFTLALPLLVIMIPFFFVLAPINLLFNKIFRARVPNEFYFNN